MSPRNTRGWLLVSAGLLLSGAEATAQERVVTGVVRNSAGAVLAGAQVSVLGTELGSVTGEDGRFQIVGLASVEVVLSVAMIGYQTEERAARAGTPVEIVLTETALNFDEIVVTGTAGGAQKRAVANAVVTVDAAEVLQNAPVRRIDEILNARSPGVVVQPPNGNVGGASRILIRGRSSFSLPSGPLVYVDGVRVEAGGTISSRLNDLDPNTIETIEVIKGPAAATLYGTEASNGVIQIITKRGRPGPARIDVSMRQGAAWFHDPEGRWLINYYRDPDTGKVVPFNLAAEETARGTPLFHTAHQQGYSLSVSGGTDRLQYHVGGTYDRDEGVVPQSWSQRYSGQVNVSAQPSERWDIDASIGVNAIRQAPEPGGSYMFGSVLNRPGSRNGPQRGWFTAPSEVLLSEFESRDAYDRTTVGTEVRHRPTGWLMHRLRFGFDLSRENTSDLTRRMTTYAAEFYTAQVAEGSKTEGSTDVLNSTIDYGATATKQLTGGLSSSITGGFQYYRRLTRSVSATGEGFPSRDVTSIAGAAIRTGTQNSEENVTIGVFIQQQLDWKNRLFITGAVRGDDNSAFGQNFEFVTYPKVSASWVLNEEPWWNVSWVDALRLRIAWGESGQQPTSFAALRTFTPTTGPGGRPAVTPQTVGNPDLGPETSREWEIGFETSLFDSRLSMDLTWFDQLTSDAIIQRDVAPSSGFPAQQYVNAGSVSNKGIELLVDGVLIRRDLLDWDVTLNLSTVKNRVVDLGLGDVPFLSFGISRFQPGYPVGAFFARRVIQADQGPDGSAINIMCDGGRPDGRAGGPPVDCGTAPQVYVGGSQDPTVQGAITSRWTIADRLTLSAMLDFKHGQRVWTSTLWCPGILDCEEEVFPERFDPVRAASSVLGYFDDQRWIRDVSFTKLREVSVSYRIPGRWLSSIGASNGSLVLAARNLYTWTDFEGLDPESTAGWPSEGGGFEENEVPQSMQFVSRVNLSF